MDYFYHYYNDCDHHSTFSPLTVDQCYCPSSTFLLSLNIILLAILIYTFTMEKVTITINPKLPFVSLNETQLSRTETNLPEASPMVTKRVNSPPGSLGLLKLPSKPLESSSKVRVSPSATFDCTATDSLLYSNGEKLINLESTTIFSDQPVESPVDSLTSFGSCGSNRRKVIKPDFSLSFFDSSLSSNSLPADEESHLLKVEDESFNILIHSGSEEDHFNQDSSPNNQIIS